MARSPRAEPEGERVDGLLGVVERFTYRDAESGFAVVRLRPEDGSGAVALVGSLAQLAEGQQVRVSGREREHPRFGTQIEVDTVEAVLPTHASGIRAYLASSLVKGIGPATAERIVERFGSDTLRIVEEEPDRLREVKGLGEKRIDELVTAVRAQKDVQEVMVFLRAHGLGPGLAARVVKRLGKGASQILQSDPYRLADEVVGVGFHTADQLARNIGLAHDAPARVRAGILHSLSQGARDGHCFLPPDELVERGTGLLDLEPERILEQLPVLQREGRVVRDDDADGIYPTVLHAAESGVARMLTMLVRTPLPKLDFDVEPELERFSRRSRLELPDEQRRAVWHAFEDAVSVVTGGPGVGKTTIVRAIAAICADEGLRLRLAAPTGRAAKRLEESTDHSASTIHRLLEYQAGINRFLRGPEDPLDGDVLVVDETSMLDVRLAYDLFRAVPPGLRLVLVGDVDQLPAVGPGQVLGDVIESRLVPVTRLTRIFRQEGGSAIVQAAHAIREGELPASAGDGGDFFVVESPSAAHARTVVRTLVTDRIPKAFGLDPMRDVQVLCPMYRGDAGADAVNADLQAALNPEGDEVERGGKRYRVGDKVLQVRNDYDLDVFNGDVGRVTAVHRGAQALRVRFDHREIEYPFADLDQLVPGYAITVHRAQGSEYPAVVVPLVTEHFVMLRRNLLYTAVTRAKRLCVLVGPQKALGLAVRNADEARRHTDLSRRLSPDGRHDESDPA